MTKYDFGGGARVIRGGHAAVGVEPVPLSIPLSILLLCFGYYFAYCIVMIRVRNMRSMVFCRSNH